MPVLENLLGGNLLDGAAKIIGLFKVPPEVALAHQGELAKIAAEQQAAILDAANRDVEAASANIRAEASSGDKFTARSRPSFMYMVILILGCNYIIFPIINRPPVNFPDALFWLFGSCVLGYTGARSWDKFNAVTKGDK